MTAAASTIKRVNNWPQLLNATIEASRNIPFTWEEQNCCFWPANVVEVLTGVDVAVDFRRKATSAAAVRKLLKQKGGVANLAAEVLPRYGLRPVPVSMAKRGDVVLALTEHGHAGGICLGADCAFPGPNGLTFLRLLNCSHAFAI